MGLLAVPNKVANECKQRAALSVSWKKYAARFHLRPSETHMSISEKKENSSALEKLIQIRISSH